MTGSGWATDEPGHFWPLAIFAMHSRKASSWLMTGDGLRCECLANSAWPRRDVITVPPSLLPPPPPPPPTEGEDDGDAHETPAW